MSIIHALAQAAAAATAPEQGVISYPPAFFADQHPANAWEMLQRLPGFTLDAGDQIRGFEGGGGNALIDGKRPASKTDDLNDILRRIPASRVERIELVRGGAPGIDMQGKAVVANVVRKHGAGLSGVLQAHNNHLYDGRNMHAARAEIAGGSGQRKWEASGRYSHLNDDGGDFGPHIVVAPGGQLLRQSQVKQEADGLQRVLTGAYETPLLGGVARINGRVFWEKFKVEQDDRYAVPQGFAADLTDGVEHERQTELGARFTRPFGTRATLEVLGLHQTERENNQSAFATPGERVSFGLLTDASETIGRSVLKHQASPRVTLEFGAEAALNRLESLSDLSLNGVPTPLPAANVEVEERRGEVFGRGSWRPTEALTLEAGVRYEASTISSEGDLALEKSLRFAKPRVAATWSPSAALQVRASLERTVGQLDFDDFVASANFNTGQGVTAGNPDLTPEQAWVAEGAVERRFWGAGVVSLTVRYAQISDVNDRGPVRAVAPDGSAVIFDQPMNIGDGWKREIVGALTLPLARLGLTGAVIRGEATWRRSQVTDPTTGEKREISALHPVDWTASFVHDLPRLRLSYGVDLYGGWRETNYRYDVVQSVKLEEPFVRPFIEWRPQPDLSIRAEGINMSRRGIRITQDRYGGPRNTHPLLYVDDRDLTFGRGFYVRVRKTFG
ncbi:TonB-dependent receptor plug domain-containing protein [Phenylobacterium sp.]|jgi:outer membrane receptor protein involved in Fe transport|uniref:TonB-dependent receptor plug domain-containing protein n=1 Tax=Phenylobacterium sp. TaxID=1871053 RepID=UPI003783D55A